MKHFCHLVAPIALTIKWVGPQVISILGVAIEEVGGLCLLAEGSL